MKKLNRTPKPKCLGKFKAGLNAWSDLDCQDYIDIWEQFDLMQSGFCAYCECYLKEKHVEHFESRGKSPAKIFDWPNLFGSCDYSTRCGKYKDSKGASPYDVRSLLKPDVDDPNDYWVYLTNGKISIKKGIDHRNSFRASETIRVFNLNGDVTLVSRRRAAIKCIEENVNELYGMLEELEPEDWLELLESELAGVRYNKLEFESALLSVWSFNTTY